VESREAKLRRRRTRTRKLLFVVLALTVIGGVAFGSWLDAGPTGSSGDALIDRIRQDLLSQEKAYGDPVNLLVIGSDSRQGEEARSDTLMFMRVDFDNRRVYIVSIPRDMRVYIPARGSDKINAAYAYGRAPLAIRTVESFLGVDLNHYVEVDFRGFKKLVDTLGGININVEKTINDRTRQYRMYIPKGPQRMDGPTALNYVRYRHGDSDFERARRQQNFLRALASNVFRVQSIFKLPALIRIFNENVGTDMSKRQMLSLGGFIRELPKNRIETVTLPGRGITIDGLSYVQPNRAEISAILERIESGRSIKNMKSRAESGKMSMRRTFSVSLLNGSGKPGLAVRAKAKLVAQGFRLITVGNADKFNYRQTEIRYSSKRQVEAYRVRRAFFGEAVMVPSPRRLSGDIEVILGADYYKFDRILY